MISAATPYTCPDVFGRTLLGTMWSPGTCIVSEHNRIKAWDVQEAKGTTGATSKKNGDPIGRFKVTYYLSGDMDDDDGLNDFTRWEAFQRLLESIVDGPTAKTLPIYHPDLALNHFTDVSVDSIGGMVRDDKGGASIVIGFLEYRPPKKKAVAKAQPKASGTAGPTAKPDPNAQRKKEVQALLDEAKKP